MTLAVTDRMLRMYCLQQWCGLADEALEDSLVDEINAHLAEQGLLMRAGTLIPAPPATWQGHATQEVPTAANPHISGLCVFKPAEPALKRTGCLWY